MWGMKAITTFMVALLALASHGAAKPLGEWNSEEVTVDGDNVTVILNGKTILACSIEDLPEDGGTPDGKPHPGIRCLGGHISLCWHNDAVWFRNMRIKEL